MTEAAHENGYTLQSGAWPRDDDDDDDEQLLVSK